MRLEPGVRLGRYEILAAIGTGGMGEVWKARDTQLERDVAVKVLPPQRANEARLRLRLATEAKAISALNHPNICTLHDVGTASGIDYLVMEYCEGETLADRLAVGRLPYGKALEHAIEIAAALSRAHGAGIVHRDLKPSNVMLTKTGAKLLDFGLARRHLERGDGTTSSLDVPGGGIAGTLAYMAPEVLSGHEADPRSDVWAFGAVLYEMLTGVGAFSGESKASVIAAILEREPRPLREIAPEVPPPLEDLVRGCLEKSPEERWQSAHDVAEALRWIGEKRRPLRRRHPALPWIGGAALVALATGFAAQQWRSRAQDEPSVRLSIPLSEAGTDDGPATIFVQHLMGNVALSPDSRRIAYAAWNGNSSLLFVRDLDRFESVAIPGTGGAGGPFFSPDGSWIGFMTGNGMKKAQLGGGPPETISPELMRARGAVWAPDGWIYYSPNSNSGLIKIRAAGGRPVAVTRLGPGESSHRWPALLPGGKRLLFTIRTDSILSFDQARIAALDLETGERHVVFDGGSRARYVPPGWLVFSREGGLHAVAFDPDTLAVRGSSRKLIDGVASGPAGSTWDWEVNQAGDLVYVPGLVPDSRTDLLKVTRSGEPAVIGTLPFSATRLALSPDARAIAVNAVFASDDIYLYDIESGVANRFSSESGDETRAVWTPDGQHVIYNAQLPTRRLVMRRVDGAGTVQDLYQGTAPMPTSCSPGGRELVFVDRGAGTGWDIWTVPLRGERRPRPLLRTRFDEGGGHVSPDGRWLLHASNEPGRWEIFVRSLEDGARWQISTEGGFEPQWSADGKEIFYRHADAMYAVAVSSSGKTIRFGRPQRLFAIDAGDGFGVTPDGFVMTQARYWDDPRPVQVNVVLGWARELRR